MRLRLFDRLRRMIRSRRSAASGAGAPSTQGRHRRVQGGFPEPPSLGSAPSTPGSGEDQHSTGPGPASAGPQDWPSSADWPGYEPQHGSRDHYGSRDQYGQGGPYSSEAQHGPGSQPGQADPYGSEGRYGSGQWPGPGLAPPAGGTREPRTPAGPGGPAADPTHTTPRTGPQPGLRVGAGQARIREIPQDALPQDAVHHNGAPQDAPAGAPAFQTSAASRAAAWDQSVRTGLAQAPAAELAGVIAGIPRQSVGPGASARRAAGGRELPLTYPEPLGRSRSAGADGRRHCGSLEKILWRQWDPASPPPREVAAAVERLAELPERIKERLAAGLDAIFIGPGGVPELDDMTSLQGVPLPAGRATWDACAGAYGERKIVVGSRPSPTPDVMCHEVGHALDDLDSSPGEWQSDSAEFRVLYEQCQPHLVSDFHHQPGGLGRKEFFADAFAAIASRQRPALVDMLGGNTRTALHVMLYFNRRYGI